MVTSVNRSQIEPLSSTKAGSIFVIFNVYALLYPLKNFLFTHYCFLLKMTMPSGYELCLKYQDKPPNFSFLIKTNTKTKKGTFLLIVRMEHSFKNIITIESK